MAGVAAAHLLVGRIRGVTSDIAALDPLDAFGRLEHGFGAPEAASGENGGFTGHSVDPCRGRMEYPQHRMRRLLFQGRRSVDQRRVARKRTRLTYSHYCANRMRTSD